MKYAIHSPIVRGDYELALNSLRNVEQQARGKKVPGHEFEAVLAHAETNLRAGRLSGAEKIAGQLRNDQRAKGL